MLPKCGVPDALLDARSGGIPGPPTIWLAPCNLEVRSISGGLVELVGPGVNSECALFRRSGGGRDRGHLLERTRQCPKSSSPCIRVRFCGRSSWSRCKCLRALLPMPAAASHTSQQTSTGQHYCRYCASARQGARQPRCAGRTTLTIVSTPGDHHRPRDTLRPITRFFTELTQNCGAVDGPRSVVVRRQMASGEFAIDNREP